MINNRAGGLIKEGMTYYWTNWYYDQVELQQPMFKIPDLVMPMDLLILMFDNRYSGYLMPMPRDNWN